MVQMALTLVLLLGSGLMIRSLSRLIQTDPGFRAEQVMAFRISLPEARYSEQHQRLQLFDAVSERIRAVPGVQAVGMTTNLPFDRRTNSTTFRIPGRPHVKGEPERHANLRFVTGDFFGAMGIPLLHGRVFDSRDDRAAPPAIVVDEQLAKQFYGAVNVVGRTIDMGGEATIIGVVATVKHGELGEVPKATLYLPLHQHGWIGAMHVAVRSSVPAERWRPRCARSSCTPIPSSRSTRQGRYRR
jgi:putative ABC transport system permease protein